MISILLISLLVCACQPTPQSKEMTAENLAIIICDCSAPIVAYNDKLRSLMTSDDRTQLAEAMATGDTVMVIAETCITDQIMTSPKQLLTPDLSEQIILQCQLDKRTIDDLIRKLRAFDKATFK